MFRLPTRLSARTRRGQVTSRFGRTRLWLQGLEERTVPAALVVTSSADDGSAGTLRSIMAVADGNGEADTITFQSGITTINLISGEIVMTTDVNNLTINGAGVTINGDANPSPSNRIFNFNVVGGNPTFTINGLTLSGGNLTTGNNGGAILMNDDPLVLSGMTFISNATAGAGGAVATGTAATKLTISNCSFSGNAAGTTGGAVNIGGAATVTVNNATFTSNTAGTTGGAIQTATTVTLDIADSKFIANQGTIGGGVRALNSNSTITINSSTFSGNTAKTGGGGGLYMAGGSLTVEASTFDTNTAATNGGGLGMTTATAVLTNCTISSNFANGGTGTGGGGITVTTGNLTLNNSTVTGNSATVLGGGIRKTSATGSLTLNSTIVAVNQATTGPDIGFTPTTTLNIGGGFNFVGVANGNFNLAGSNQTGSSTFPLDPLLTPLGDHGGPTYTHALFGGSLALDNGSNVLPRDYDQRGVGFPRMLGTGTDVGAFELNNALPTAKTTLANVPPINPTYTATVVFSDDVGMDTSSIGVGNVTLEGPGLTTLVPISAGVMGSGLSVTATYTFNPPGGFWDWTDNGKYTLVIQPNQVFDTEPIPNAATPGPIGSFIVSAPLPPALVVDNASDVDDGKYTTGNLSLREAIKLSNIATGTTESISFDAALNGQTIVLANTLTITDPVVVVGPGASNLTISGDESVRLFEIAITATNSSVSFSGLTFTKGRATNGGAFLVSDETMTFSRCVFNNNVGLSGNDSGGAIRVTDAGGSLTIDECWFDANSSSGGGAIVIQNGAGLLVTNSLFTNNVTNVGNAGGAIRYGGAIGAFGVNIRNSTFTGNRSNFTGGAIGFGTGFAGQAFIQNCTIVNNSADDDGGTGIGGGVGALATTTGQITIESSIVYGNVKNMSSVPSDIGSPNLITAINCIIGTSVDAPNFAPNATTMALLGQDPMLAGLTDNGGPTQTMALMAGSLAIDKGSNPSNLQYDQRGPGFPRNSGGAGVDIGAFEIQSAVAPPTISGPIVIAGGTQRSLVKDIVITFSEAVTIAPGAFSLKGYALGPIGDVELNVSALVGNSVTITFKTGGGGFISLDPGLSLPDGQYELTIDSSKISGAGGNLDGNNNGTYDGAADNVSSKLHRLFGDGNGDGSVTAADFNAFRLVYGSVGPSIYDYDNSGDVTAADFNAFRLRYGLSGYTP